MTMAAAVTMQIGGRQHCDLVVFDRLPADVVHGDEITVWYRVSAQYRPKSGDWIGLFVCTDDDDDDDDTCCVAVSGSYSYVSFQWAPKYPNIEKTIPRRRVVFDSELIKVDTLRSFVVVVKSGLELSGGWGLTPPQFMSTDACFE